MILIKKYVKSNSFLYLIIAMTCLLFACLLNDYDYDLYARLIVGEYFFKTGWITSKDFLSYTPTHVWYDHEWGSSVVFYTFYKLFGNFGLILVQSITMFFTAFFVIKTQKLQEKAYPVSIFFILTFLLLYIHQNPSIVRCHMFSFMFFSMLLYFLEKTRLKNSNILWLMLPITVIWNNLHGGVVSGLGIIFLYAIGEFISKKPFKKYILVFTLSSILLLINPYGYEYLSFLISANTKSRIYITEWMSVFANRHILYYFTIFFIGVLSLILALDKFIKKRKIEVTRTLILITTIILGMQHVKLLSLTLITTFALFYNEICRIFNKNIIKFLNKLTLLIMFVAIFGIPFTQPQIARTQIYKYPVKEVEFLKINNIKGNILTQFGLGSYVSFKLYPNNLIYMDGRYEEVYDDEVFDDLKKFELVSEDWDTVLTKYKTDILLIKKHLNIYKHLKTQKSWINIYEGPICSIFIKKGSVNHKNSYLKPTDNIKYYRHKEFENMGYFGK